MLAVPPIRLTPWTTVLLSRSTCTRTIFLARSCSSPSLINSGLRLKRRTRVGLLTSTSETLLPAPGGPGQNSLGIKERAESNLRPFFLYAAHVRQLTGESPV